MPKIIDPARREDLKGRMLRLLGANSRKSNNELAKALGIPRSTAQVLFAEIVKERGMRFTAEVGIEELWRWEFIKQARTYNKKGILEKVVDNLPELGFEEFLIFLKFLNGVPDEGKIIEALGDSYIPQFAGRLHGDYDIVIYALARNYNDANRFVINLTKNFEKSRILTELINIRRSYGFFPLHRKLLEQFSIQETYKRILLGINEDGRREFSGIARESKHSIPHILYAYERLLSTGILRRVTYYETVPEKPFSVIVQMKILNEAQYLASRPKWLLSMVNDSARGHTNYTFMCDFSNPQGTLIFMNFRDGGEVEDFLARLNGMVEGIETRYFVITKVLRGALGVRDFDMRHTKQYVLLEDYKLVPKRDRKEEA